MENIIAPHPYKIGNNHKKFLRSTLCACFLLLNAVILFHSTAWGDVWEVTQEWSEEWERRYSTWLEEDIKPDILKPSGIKADCADLAYGLRAIFARKNGLPFLSTSQEGARIGHFSTAWDRFPTHPEWERDKRFCVFLSVLFQDMVSTRTLYNDTYPIALIPEAISPGVIVYEDIIAAHAVTIGRIKNDTLLPVTYYESFIPGYTTFSTGQKIDTNIYGPDISIEHSGVVRWNWPVKLGEEWDYVPEETMPHYSLDQYRQDFAYRGRIGVLLNRLAFERLNKAPFSEELFLDILSEAYLDVFSRSMTQYRRTNRAIGHVANPNSADRTILLFNNKENNQELKSLLMGTWPLLGGYGIPRSQWSERLERYDFVLYNHRPPISMSTILETMDWSNHVIETDPPTTFLGDLQWAIQDRIHERSKR